VIYARVNLTIIRIVLLEIGVGVTGKGGTVVSDIHEGIENVGNLFDGKIGRLVVAGIDTPKFPVLVRADSHM
jgi:hypothetical protein